MKKSSSFAQRAQKFEKVFKHPLCAQLKRNERFTHFKSDSSQYTTLAKAAIQCAVSYAFPTQARCICIQGAEKINICCSGAPFQFQLLPPFFFVCAVVCFTRKHLKISSVAVLSAARKYLLFLKIAPRKGFSFPFCC